MIGIDDEERDGSSRGWFLRAAAFVGDFGHPFYAEERQRDVWNEACAFGLQLTIWTALLAGTATVWVVGAPAVPFVMATLALVGFTSWATLLYATRLGVTLTGPDQVVRFRLVPYLAVSLLLAVGAWRATPGGSGFFSGFLTGTVVGLVGTIALVAIGALRQRRRLRGETPVS